MIPAMLEEALRLEAPVQWNARIIGRGGAALGIEVDVADEAGVRAMTDRTIAEYGKLDILFCNVGIGAPRSSLDVRPDGT